MDTTRRDVLKLSIAVAGMTAGLMAQSSAEGVTAPPTPTSTRKGDMLYRTLGRTGEQVSVVGLGGHHIGRPNDEQEGIRLIRTAIDRGITFMDNSWETNKSTLTLLIASRNLSRWPYETPYNSLLIHPLLN